VVGVTKKKECMEKAGKKNIQNQGDNITRDARDNGRACEKRKQEKRQTGGEKWNTKEMVLQYKVKKSWFAQGGRGRSAGLPVKQGKRHLWETKKEK